MTVESTSNKMPTYMGNGITYAFPYSFKINDKTDVKVYKTGVNGNTTLLGSGYVVIPNDPLDLSTGGHVQYPDPLPGIKLAAGEKLTILREVDFIQDTDFKIQGTTNTHVFEAVADKLTMMIQQLGEKIMRSMVASVTSNSADYTLPDPSANKAIVWNADGTGFVNQDIQPGVNEFAVQIVSTVPDGIAPLVVESTTEVENLTAENVGSKIGGKDIGDIFEADGVTVKNTTLANAAKGDTRFQISGGCKDSFTISPNGNVLMQKITRTIPAGKSLKCKIVSCYFVSTAQTFTYLGINNTTPYDGIEFPIGEDQTEYNIYTNSTDSPVSYIINVLIRNSLTSITVTISAGCGWWVDLSIE
jgi:hypothetical protein